MAVELMLGYRKLEENDVVKEAASGIESVEKLMRILSQAQSPISSSSADSAVDYRAATDAAVSKFKRVISLLGRTRTGHARFRRGPVPSSSPASVAEIHIKQEDERKIYYATPIQQIPPAMSYNPYRKRQDSPAGTINFSYSSAGNASFKSSMTGESEMMSKQQQQQQGTTTSFQLMNHENNSHSNSKPPLSSCSSLKRKCSSDSMAGGKCSGSSAGRCHCSSKKR